MAPASSKEFLDIQANYRVWIHAKTRTGDDNNIQSVEDLSKLKLESLCLLLQKSHILILIEIFTDK